MAQPDVFLPELLQRIADLMPPNDVACGLRLVNRATAQQFRQRTTIRLSQPLQRWAFASHWSAAGACRALTRRQREKLLCCVAASGDVLNLEVAVAAAGLALESCEVLMAAAAAGGKVESCRWLKDRGCPLDWTALEAAARAGQREACEWCLAEGARWPRRAVHAAVQAGHIELAMWLFELKPEGEQLSWAELLPVAADGCGLTTLQQLWAEHGASLDEAARASALNCAAASRSPGWRSKVAWLMEQGCVLSDSVCKAACAAPDAADRLAWLRDWHGLPPTEECLNTAARWGNGTAVRWLLEAGVRTQAPGVAANAAHSGCLEPLQALHAAGCPMDPAQAFFAPLGGSAAVALWLLDISGTQALGRPTRIWSYVAQFGSVELFAALRNRGIAWRPGAWSDAAHGGCEAVLEWLVEQGCRFPGDGAPYRDAARVGDVTTLRALQRVGCPLPARASAFNSAVRAGAPVPALRCLAECGCPVDWETAAATADRRAATAERAGVSACVREWLAEERRRRRPAADPEV